VTMGAFLSLLVPNIPPDEEPEWSPEDQPVAAADGRRAMWSRAIER
jgi:hypothetical protein